MHMRKVHGNTLPVRLDLLICRVELTADTGEQADGHCQWSGCTRKFRQLAGLQSHLEQAHARSDLHCAYQGAEI